MQQLVLWTRPLGKPKLIQARQHKIRCGSLTLQALSLRVLRASALSHLRLLSSALAHLRYSIPGSPQLTFPAWSAAPKPTEQGRIVAWLAQIDGQSRRAPQRSPQHPRQRRRRRCSCSPEEWRWRCCFGFPVAHNQGVCSLAPSFTPVARVLNRRPTGRYPGQL